ncbi:MAG: LysM peptidoglycan-binding domain-containing protein [Clostridiales bacterium]|jgi:LysM repeat protein|nr:LysM peptidoglycan-binding domain-containing protein [Clostridiales bacterium]
MEHSELPANIKQIGSIGEGLRIYMEDYVCSYLHAYAEAGGYQERIAILIGRYMVIDSQPILFINGAVQGKYTEVRNGLTIFTERSMEYAQTCVEQYFPGQKIVGWMQSQPSYGVYLNSGYIDVHIGHFKKKYQVMFIMDPIEKTNAFYTYTKSGMTLEESKGYFIYYDKNEAMHEYMVRNRMDFNDMPAVIHGSMSDKDEKLGEYDRIGDRESHTAKRGDREHLPAPAVLRSRGIPRKEQPDQRRMLNLLVGLSAVLFIVSFIMGAGLIQNQDRIATLERQTSVLLASYQNLAQNISNSAQSVFAGSEQILSSPTPNGTATDGAGTPTIPATVIEENGAVTLTPIPSSTPRPSSYTVKAGDTLNSIAVKFFGTTDMVDSIMQYNNITDPNLIVSGTVIKIPE